jgi:protein-L-isoaspartate(D-aspartate) O-methyltransferase
VFSVDIVEEFVAIAAAQLYQLGHSHVSLRVGDGSRGWSEAGPFDAILVSAAARELPMPLAEQLKEVGSCFPWASRVPSASSKLCAKPISSSCARSWRSSSPNWRRFSEEHSQRKAARR